MLSDKLAHAAQEFASALAEALYEASKKELGTISSATVTPIPTFAQAAPVKEKKAKKVEAPVATSAGVVVETPKTERKARKPLTDEAKAKLVAALTKARAARAAKAANKANPPNGASA